MVEQFANVIKNESFSAALRPVMETLFSLYCVHGIVEQARDFLEVKLWNCFYLDDYRYYFSDPRYFYRYFYPHFSAKRER